MYLPLNLLAQYRLTDLIAFVTIALYLFQSYLYSVYQRLTVFFSVYFLQSLKMEEHASASEISYRWSMRRSVGHETTHRVRIYISACHHMLLCLPVCVILYTTANDKRQKRIAAVSFVIYSIFSWNSIADAGFCCSSLSMYPIKFYFCLMCA